MTMNYYDKMSSNACVLFFKKILNESQEAPLIYKML